MEGERSVIPLGALCWAWILCNLCVFGDIGSYPILPYFCCYNLFCCIWFFSFEKKGVTWYDYLMRMSEIPIFYFFFRFVLTLSSSAVYHSFLFFRPFVWNWNLRWWG